MTTFVCCSGSWHGGWSWKRVRPLLEAAGHTVATPTYTGVGDRVHLGGPDVTLDTHIQDICNAIVYEDLRDVVLVGHSYGGVVMIGVADRLADRVAQLVALDTSIAADGDSVIRLMSEASRAVVLSHADEWRVAPTSVDRLGIDDPADRRWVASRLTHHPLRGFTEPLHLSGAYEAIPRSYIACQRDPAAEPRPAAIEAARRGWPMRTIPSGHDAMITAPAELTAALLALSSA